MDDDSVAANRFSNHESVEKGYALSGKIMLSAIIVLFAVVVIMVFLHIYARWYLISARRRQHRRGRRRTHFVFYVEPNNPASIVASYPPRGLDANVLKSLPTFTYSAKNDDEDREVLECAVCLCEFEENEKGRLLPKCNHSFHLDCIDMWFHSHSTCPLCRSPVDADSSLPVEGSANQNVSAAAAAAAAEEERDIVVDIGELTPTQRVSNQGYDLRQRNDGSQFGTIAGRPGPSTGFGSSSSFAARMKGADFVGVEIEVPRRSISFSNNSNSDGSRLSSPGRGGQPLKSPTSRLLSLKRILSREKKSPLPSPSSGVGTSCWSGGDSDVEAGRSETEPLSPAQTPR